MSWFCRVALLLLMSMSVSSCGYNLGFSKPTALKDAQTLSVEMFDNNSLEPLAGILVTNAVADMVQRDGTFRLASSSKADLLIRGAIRRVNFRSLRPNPSNTYISSEISLYLEISFELIDKKTGKVVLAGKLDDEAAFYNESGNVQAARESALGYAAQKIAENLQFVVMSS